MIQRFFLLLILSILVSCKPEEGSRRLPRHSGESGEVLVVMNEDLWLGAPGDSLRKIFESYVPNLPQAEPRFSLLQFTPAQMSDLLRQHRNIVQINIGNEVKDNEGVKLANDKWSNAQIVFTANSGNIPTFYAQLNTQFGNVADLIDQKEVERLQLQYLRVHNEKIEALVVNKFGINISLPADCEIAKNAEDFLWIKRERLKYVGNQAHEIVEGYIIYTYPYQSDSAFTQSSILDQRDSLLKKYVPGPKPKTYMTTERRYPPVSVVKSLKGKYAVATEGLWRTENYFMGGPSASLTTTTVDGAKVISVYGFVFAPKFDKREYIREIKAVVNSIKFPETAE